ncbi:hypothetical protein TB1_004484 [Malus domestica]
MLSGEGVAASSTRFKSKRRSEGPDIFKGVEEKRGQTNQDLRNARRELLLVEIQKSKRRLLSQKLGCSETTKADLRNRRGVFFLKSWTAQRLRRLIAEIEETLAFSKVGLLRDHEGRSQKSKKHLLFQPCQHLSHAHSTLRKLRAFCRRFLVK